MNNEGTDRRMVDTASEKEEGKRKKPPLSWVWESRGVSTFCGAVRLSHNLEMEGTS